MSKSLIGSVKVSSNGGVEGCRSNNALACEPIWRFGCGRGSWTRLCFLQLSGNEETSEATVSSVEVLHKFGVDIDRY
jgi:hypothetical protein